MKKWRWMTVLLSFLLTAVLTGCAGPVTHTSVAAALAGMPEDMVQFDLVRISSRWDGGWVTGTIALQTQTDPADEDENQNAGTVGNGSYRMWMYDYERNYILVEVNADNVDFAPEVGAFIRLDGHLGQGDGELMVHADNMVSVEQPGEDWAEVHTTKTAVVETGEIHDVIELEEARLVPEGDYLPGRGEEGVSPEPGTVVRPFGVVSGAEFDFYHVWVSDAEGDWFLSIVPTDIIDLALDQIEVAYEAEHDEWEELPDILVRFSGQFCMCEHDRMFGEVVAHSVQRIEQ